MAATSVDDWRATLRERMSVPAKIQKARKFAVGRLTGRSRRKPAWDDSINDLSVFKASPADLERRHQIHQPKPDEDRIQRRQPLGDYGNKENQSPYSVTEHESMTWRKRALIREIFHTQERELRQVLKETDETINEVKDLFKDEPKKYRSVPNMTSAPVANRRHVPLAEIDDYLVYPQVLNSGEGGNSDTENEQQESDNTPQPEIAGRSKFSGNLNLDYYQKLLADEERQKWQQQELDDKPRTMYRSPNVITKERDRRQCLPMPNNEGAVDGSPQQGKGGSDLNEETKSAGRDQPASSFCGKTSRFSDLQQLLDIINKEINELEGNRVTSVGSLTQKSQAPVSGFTSALLDILLRLVKHLKMSKIQRDADLAVMNSLREDFEEQKILIDALTSELIDSQEQTLVLFEEFARYKESIDGKAPEQQQNCPSEASV